MPRLSSHKGKHIEGGIQHFLPVTSRTRSLGWLALTGFVLSLLCGCRQVSTSEANHSQTAIAQSVEATLTALIPPTSTPDWTATTDAMEEQVQSTLTAVATEKVNPPPSATLMSHATDTPLTMASPTPHVPTPTASPTPSPVRETYRGWSMYDTEKDISFEVSYPSSLWRIDGTRLLHQQIPGCEVDFTSAVYAVYGDDVHISEEDIRLGEHVWHVKRFADSDQAHSAYENDIGSHDTYIFGLRAPAGTADSNCRTDWERVLETFHLTKTQDATSMLTTAPAYKTYTNEEVGFSLDYPADWCEDTIAPDYVILTSYDQSKRLGSQFGFIEGDLKIDVNVKAADSSKGLVEYLSDNEFQEVEILSEEWLMLDGNRIPAVVRLVSSSMGQNLHLMTMLGENLIIVAAYGDLEPLDDALQIMYSFRIDGAHERHAGSPTPEVACAPGLFYAEGQTRGFTHYSLLRFYADGLVLGVTVSPQDGASLEESWNQIDSWFNREATGQHVGSGQYSLVGTRLTFSLTSETGVVEYDGSCSGDTMNLHSISHINDHEQQRVFIRFPGIEFE